MGAVVVVVVAGVVVVAAVVVDADRLAGPVPHGGGVVLDALALAVAVAEGKTLRKAVEFATNASAHSVAIPHVMQSLPTREELEREFMICTPVKF